MQAQVLPKRLERNRKEYKRNRIISWLYAMLGAAAITALLFGVMLAGVRISGESMTPTLSQGDIVLVNKLAFYMRSVQRGDMVAFMHPQTGAKIIRRVIALPNERVLLEHGNVYINGIWLNEYAYVPELFGDMDEVAVPEGCVFVLCDNRGLGPDSRSPEIGFVPIAELIGKVKFRVSPFSSAAVFD